MGSEELNEKLQKILENIPADQLWERADDVKKIKQALKTKNTYYKQVIINSYGK